MVAFNTDNGHIRITNSVFTAIAGDAASSCFGVKGMAVRSMSDGLVHLLRREAMSKGVGITYGDDNTISIELHIVVDNGVNIPAICGSIINEVSYKVTAATGIKVKNVDVYVDSMTV